MVRVVGVRFKKAGKVYYFDPAEYPITAGARVVVETARGVEYGEVAVGPKDVTEEEVVQPLKRVLRLGSEKDAVMAAENKRKEREAFASAQKRIESHSLDMNLVDVEYTFDGSKVIFYFTAEGRIDFRELVRDLAGLFRTRIEMRQIGVRDEAKLLGGIGPCGRILCCTSFLGDFAPVSIRMAKDQNLSLNPSKISGLCGRLMCCLRYEQETYDAAKKDPTLAPGYIAPVFEEPAVNLDELEESPLPAIRFKSDNGPGMGARIAQAVGLVERAPRREESALPGPVRNGDRPTPRPASPERRDRRGPEPDRTDRRSAEKVSASAPVLRGPQMAPRPEGGARLQLAEPTGIPGDRSEQPRRSGRRRGRGQGQGERPQGDRRPHGGQPAPRAEHALEGRAPQLAPPSVQSAGGDSADAPARRSRNRRRRRRGGGGGGEKQQPGGEPQG